MSRTSGTSFVGVQRLIDRESGELGTIDLIIDPPVDALPFDVGYFYAGRCSTGQLNLLTLDHGIVYSQGIIIQNAGVRAGPYPLNWLYVRWKVAGLAWNTIW